MKAKRNSAWPYAASGFALGASAGSAAALLLAPTSGRNARKKLVTKFRSMGRSAAHQLNQGQKLLVKKAEFLKDAAVEQIGDTRDWLLEKIPSNGRRPTPRRAAHR